MLTSDIVKQLQAELPQLTDDFSEKVSVNSATQIGNNLTIEATLGTTPPVNSSITIEGLKLSNAVVTEVATGTTIKLTFTKKHDVTLTEQYKQVYLTNADSLKDGLYDLLEVGEKYLIIDTTETGFVALIETRAGYNGLFKVTASALNELTVDLEFANTLPFYTTDAFVKYGSRIYGIGFIDNINEYITTFPDTQPTTTGKPFMFVLNLGTSIDSDKTTVSDVNAPKNAGSSSKIIKIRNFDIIAVYPANESIGGFQELTKCEQLELILDKCLMGLVLPSYTQTESSDVIIPLSNEPLGFNKSFYSHLYSYQTQYYETNVDGYKYPSYKFREFEVNYYLPFDDYEDKKKTDVITLENE